ncbi:MAG: BT_3928 family protein [Runella sp.]
MKIIAHIVRIIVGVIFIFSGLVKLNDPTGTQIKLEEYFEVFATDFAFMHDFWIALIPYALYFSILMCAAEVVLGVALLVSWRLKLINWILLGLIVFFTFLTFYSAYYNKVTDCGCFGDFVKLKPWTSFGKDVVLLVLILFLIWQSSLFKSLRTGWLVGLSAIFSLGLAIYAIRYLPPFDFLPYKVGNNIPQLMQPSEPLRYKYIMEKDGKTQAFEKFPTDTTYKYKDMVLVNEYAKPKITDYKVWNDEGDFTQQTFEGQKLIIIIKNGDELNTASLAGIRKLIMDLKETSVVPLILTSLSQDQIEQIRSAHLLEVPYYYADGTVLKTIVRSNPGIWLLQNGTVKGKWHYNTTPTAEEVLKRVRP